MFYKITKAQAELIGTFTHEGVNFSPFTREQMDGTFVVSEEMYQRLKDTEQFRQFNWSEVETTTSFNDKNTIEFGT